MKNNLWLCIALALTFCMVPFTHCGKKNFKMKYKGGYQRGKNNKFFAKENKLKRKTQ